MIIDFLKLDGEQEYTVDLCIIGSGAVGIALALEFMGGGNSVLVLAGGGADHEPIHQTLYGSHVIGLPHSAIHDGRARVYGGTTTWWAGQASPLDPIDFRVRPWVPYSGWPLEPSELEPYFPRAERVMGLPSMTYDERSWPPGFDKLPPFDPCELRLAISQFATVPDFRVLHGKALGSSQNVRVLLHANAVSIVSNQVATSVDHLIVKALGGKEGIVRARYYVLCCGAIENARLLLASNKVEPHGLGNRHDVVGRFFQEHVHIETALVIPTDRRRIRRLFSHYYQGWFKRAPKLAASPALQERERILNVATELIYRTPDDSPVEAAKLLLKAASRRDLWGRVPKAILNIARSPHDVAIAAFRYGVLKKSVAHCRGPIRLGVQSETEPNPASRVTLGSDVDALGVRRTILDWRLTDLDRKTIETFVRVVASEFARLDLGVIDLDSYDLTGLPGRLEQGAHAGGHQMGTTRMHSDPRKGVVDRDSRVHGFDNLLIGGASVFPTGGFSNPTINAIAIVLRMAGQLKVHLARVGGPSLLNT